MVVWPRQGRPRNGSGVKGPVGGGWAGGQSLICPFVSPKVGRVLVHVHLTTSAALEQAAS